ncbi:MAG TPA: right-handed parallel beta-helix repeat-containing protein, partial [Planctomycetota bacterium]|nr:right-handed parallel beta-helix repeat-containing protein [Planctomycetota bacterium]
MQRITLLLVSVFLSSAVCISAMADAYYVNDAEPDDGVAAGSAANSGTSPGDPVNSVQVLLDRYPEIGSGCTVYVSPGTYYGNIVLDSPHSGLVLVGAGADVTKIDSAYGDPCLTLTDFTGGTITGFSFVNGWSTPAGGGGGAEIWSSSVVITGNVFSGNYLDMADAGGGVFIGPDSSVVFADNDVYGNFGDGLVCSFASGSLISGNRITGNVGDGIACRSCSPAITGNLVTGNGAWWGGGISCSDLAGLAVTNNTIADNGTSGWGGVGILCTGADVILRNCIVWGNSLQIALVWTSTTTVSYSGVEGGNAAIYRESGSTLSWGTGNIDSDPQFVSRGYRDDNGTADIWDDFWVEGDYHLLSAGGRWDPALGDWVFDSVTSPCIDSGDPLYAVFDEPEPNGGRTNLGSYGNTSQASRTPNLLIVMSTPAAGIAIGGTIPGTTFYTIFRGGVVILSAPHQALIQGVLHKFVRWTVDDVPMPDGQTDVDVALVSLHNATVAYEPAPASVVANLVAELVPIAEPVAATGATASTVLNTGYTAAMAIDGNTSTAWVSAACFDPRREYITIDTGGLHPVAGVRMLPRSGYPGLFPANFDILASVDGTVWTRAASEAGYAGASGIWYQNAFAERPARYVRIDAPTGMLYTNGRHYVQIAEVQALTAARMFLRLRWTAPEGDIAGYEIRYAGNELADDQSWQAGTVLASPSPSVPAGGIETVTIGIDGLPPVDRLYVALQPRSAAGALSGLSNSP